MDGMDFVIVCLCLFVCLSASLLAKYLTELWMDSDEICWTAWVCDKDESIRFW